MRRTYTCPLRPEETMARDAIHGVVCKAYGIEPGSITHIHVDNPVSMDRSNITYLSQHEYYVAHKADGVRNLLVMVMATIEGQHRPVAALVDRAGHMNLLDVLANLSHFENEMVLDGELCYHEQDKRTDFLVFNVLSGTKSLYKDTYARRLEIMDQMVLDTIRGDDVGHLAELGYVVANNPHMTIRRKRVECARNLKSMSCQPSPNFKFDGYIFTPNTGVTAGRQQTLLKWKTNNTIDVTVQARYTGTDWIDIAVLLDDDGRLVDMAQSITNVRFDTSTVLFKTILSGFLEYHRIFIDASDASNIVFSCVVEVSCTPVDGGFSMKLERLRLDKDGPNNVTTVRRTIQTIQDNITLSQICSTIDVFYHMY